MCSEAGWKQNKYRQNSTLAAESECNDNRIQTFLFDSRLLIPARDFWIAAMLPLIHLVSIRKLPAAAASGHLACFLFLEAVVIHCVRPSLLCSILDTDAALPAAAAAMTQFLHDDQYSFTSRESEEIKTLQAEWDVLNMFLSIRSMWKGHRIDRTLRTGSYSQQKLVVKKRLKALFIFFVFLWDLWWQASRHLNWRDSLNRQFQL